MLLGRQQRLGLGNQFGFLSAGSSAQGVDNGQIQPACAEGGRGHIDDVVGARIKLAGGGTQGDGLADADLAGDHAQQ